MTLAFLAAFSSQGCTNSPPVPKLTIQHHTDGTDLIRFQNITINEPTDASLTPLVDRLKQFRGERHKKNPSVWPVSVAFESDDESAYVTVADAMFATQASGLLFDLPTPLSGKVYLASTSSLLQGKGAPVVGPWHGDKPNLVRADQSAIEPSSLKILLLGPENAYASAKTTKVSLLVVIHPGLHRTGNPDPYEILKPIASIDELGPALAEYYKQSSDKRLVAAETRIFISPDCAIRWGDVRRACLAASDAGFRWMILCVPR